MSRGGSSLGASGTGFPEYMTDTHEEWLGRTGTPEVINFNIVELMNTAFAASTPFEQFDYVDPESWLEDVEGAIDDVVTELSNLDSEVDWKSSITKALAEVATMIDTDYATVATAMTAAWGNLTTKAKTELAIIVTDTHIATIIAYFSSWSDLIDTAITKAGTAIPGDFAAEAVVSITAWATVIDNAITKANATISGDFASEAVVGIETWANIIDTAITKAGTAIPDAFAAVAIGGITDWTTIIDDAKTKRDAIFSDSEMAGKVDAYEDDTLSTYQREIARFSGGMADINAVNSSAFMIGLALLARRRVQDVNKFRADLRVEYEKESLKFINATATLRSELERGKANIYGNLLGLHARIKKEFIQGTSTLRSDLEEGKADIYGNLLGIHARIRKEFISGTATLYSDIEKNKSNIYGNLLGLHARIRKEFMESASELAADIESKRADTHRLLEDAHADRKVTFVTKSLTSMVEMLLNQTRLRVMATNSGIGEMMKYKLTTADMNRALASLTAEFNRLKIVASQEYLDRTLDLDIKNTLWDMNVYQYGTNVLSGIGAGGQLMPEKMSAAQSALGGALSGAALGLQSGGGPAAIAGGAIIGGIGGYLAGG